MNQDVIYPLLNDINDIFAEHKEDWAYLTKDGNIFNRAYRIHWNLPNINNSYVPANKLNGFMVGILKGMQIGLALANKEK